MIEYWRRATQYAFAFLLIFASNAVAQSNDRLLRIGAWNVKADKASDARFIPKWRVPRIAQVIASLQPDVLAVSEIAPDRRLREVRDHLKVAGLCYRSSLLKQSSKLNVGFLYRCDVDASNARLIPESGYGPDDNRKALAMDFRVGDFDFTAVAAHFKSGGGKESQSLRDEQVMRVWDFVKSEVIPSEKDVLIMGDYNMTPTRDPENFKTLNPENFFRYISSEELEPREGFNKVFSHISNERGGNLLDGMTIGRSGTTEYVPNSVAIVPMDLFMASKNLKDFKRSYSDHLPIMATFRNVDED